MFVPNVPIMLYMAYDYLHMKAFISCQIMHLATSIGETTFCDDSMMKIHKVYCKLHQIVPAFVFQSF